MGGAIASEAVAGLGIGQMPDSLVREYAGLFGVMGVAGNHWQSSSSVRSHAIILHVVGDTHTSG